MEQLSQPEEKPVPKESQTQDPGLLRKKHRMDGQRICRVCGDKAVAHNFDVITCESCKTFFRRNAHKPQKECAFEGKCEITVNTRRFCPACRLKKCFAIGMRADMILDEVERKARMELIAENRKKRRLEAAKEESGKTSISNARDGGKEELCTQSPECDSSRLDLSFTSQEPGTASTADSFLDLLAGEVPEFRQEVQASDQSPTQFTSSQSEEQRVQVRKDRVSDRRSLAVNFKHVPAALLPSDPLMYWRLTAEEHTLLTRLTIDYKETLLQMPTTPEALRLRLEDMDLDDTLGYCEHFATDFVNFIKRLPDFRALDMNDQMAAVKGNGMRCLLLKGAACFSEERDAWLKDFGEVPVAAFMRVTQHEDVVGRYADFSRTLKRILKNDYTGFVLLNLILLFEPQAARLFDRQTVNMLHDKYAILLKHHLESQYSYLFASQYQDAIWDCVDDSKVLAADMISMFNKWKDIVGPLMAEVINLQ